MLYVLFLFFSVHIPLLDHVDLTQDYPPHPCLNTDLIISLIKSFRRCPDYSKFPLEYPPAYLFSFSFCFIRMLSSTSNTGNWISELLVHNTPSKNSVAQNSKHLLLLMTLGQLRRVLVLARLTNMSVVSRGWVSHSVDLTLALSLMFGCRLATG